MGELWDLLADNPILLLLILGWAIPAIIKGIQNAAKRQQGPGGQPRTPGQRQAPGQPGPGSPAPQARPAPQKKPAPQQTLKDLFPELFGGPKRPEPEPPSPPPTVAREPDPVARQPLEVVPSPLTVGEGLKVTPTLSRPGAHGMALESLHERYGGGLRYAIVMHAILGPPGGLRQD